MPRLDVLDYLRAKVLLPRALAGSPFWRIRATPQTFSMQRESGPSVLVDKIVPGLAPSDFRTMAVASVVALSSKEVCGDATSAITPPG